MLKRLVSLAFAFAFAALAPGFARAQTETGAPGASPAAESPAGASPAEISPDSVERRWPGQIIARPLTLFRGAWAAGTDVASDRTVENIFLSFGGDYGVTDELEISLGYDRVRALADPGGASIQGAVRLGGGYALVRRADLELVGQVRGTYDFALDQAGASTGVRLRYLINDKLALTLPGDQLVVSLDPTGSRLRLPVGVAYQVTPFIYTELVTGLADIKLSGNGGTQLFGADTIPLELRWFFTPINVLDIGAGFATDLRNDPGDNLSLMISVRYVGGV